MRVRSSWDRRMISRDLRYISVGGPFPAVLPLSTLRAAQYLARRPVSPGSDVQRGLKRRVRSRSTPCRSHATIPEQLGFLVEESANWLLTLSTNCLLLTLSFSIRALFQQASSPFCGGTRGTPRFSGALAKPPFQSWMAASTFHEVFHGVIHCFRRSTFAEINRVPE